ncbi:MAG: DUF4339 domain-containing protein [Verrucomicrobiales bacterium]|nr:DUF4339 domain-containing protein [Verrucomicrobiales bacterium]
MPVSYPLTTLVMIGLLSSIASAGGVLGADWWQRKHFHTDSFRNHPGAIAASQKVLLVGVILSVFAGHFFSLLGFPAAYWMTPAVGVYMVTLALGYSNRQQIMWLIGCCSTVGLLRAIGFFFISFSGNEPVVLRFLGIPGALISLGMIFALNKRTTTTLKETGLKPGAFGVPVRHFPALSSQAIRADQTPSNSDTVSSPGHTEDSFYYVGPNNESIGPVSKGVLVQLHNTGVVSSETMVAQAGQDEWEPMRNFLVNREQ